MTELHVPVGAVIITPAQMYDEIRQVREEVSHLSALLDPAINSIRDDLKDVREVAKDHETRLRGVERRVWVAAGVAAVIALGGSQAVNAALGAG